MGDTTRQYGVMTDPALGGPVPKSGLAETLANSLGMADGLNACLQEIGVRMGAVPPAPSNEEKRSAGNITDLAQYTHVRNSENLKLAEQILARL